MADAIEYSPSIVYEYFASKDELLGALLQDGFRTLASMMERAQRSTPDPDQQVVQVIDAYWHFARQNPDLYQLMHGLAGVPTDPAVRANAVQDVATIAADTLVAWARANNVQLDDPNTSAEVVWSLLHGWGSLALINGVYSDHDRARLLLHQAVGALLHGWRTMASST